MPQPVRPTVYMYIYIYGILVINFNENLHQILSSVPCESVLPMYHAPNTNGFVNLFIAFKPISFRNVVWKTTSILSRHQCVNYNDYVSCVCRQGYSYLSTFCRLGHHQRSWEDVKRRWENIKKRGMFQNNFPPFLHLLYVIYIFQDFSIEQLCHKCSIHSLNESVSQKLRHQFKNIIQRLLWVMKKFTPLKAIFVSHIIKVFPVHILPPLYVYLSWHETFSNQTLHVYVAIEICTFNNYHIEWLFLIVLMPMISWLLHQMEPFSL